MEELCPEESEEGGEDDGADNESDQESICWRDWLVDELPVNDSNADDDDEEEEENDWYARTVLCSAVFEPISNIIMRICRVGYCWFSYFIYLYISFLISFCFIFFTYIYQRLCS